MFSSAQQSGTELESKPRWIVVIWNKLQPMNASPLSCQASLPINESRPRSYQYVNINNPCNHKLVLPRNSCTNVISSIVCLRKFCHILFLSLVVVILWFSVKEKLADLKVYPFTERDEIEHSARRITKNLVLCKVI